MKQTIAVLGFALLLSSAASLRADLLGSTVNGSLTFDSSPTNFFDPANGFVPSGYGNSVSPSNVPIGSGIEFGYNDGANLDTADFSANGLTLRDVCLTMDSCLANSPFKMTFTDASFGSAEILTNELGVSLSFSGDTITINYPGTPILDGSATTIISIETAQAPEPGTMGLVATGILGAAGTLRRRFLA